MSWPPPNFYRQRRRDFVGGGGGGGVRALSHRPLKFTGVYALMLGSANLGPFDLCDKLIRRHYYAAGGAINLDRTRKLYFFGRCLAHFEHSNMALTESGHLVFFAV